MQKAGYSGYFLGANTPAGFRSLFERSYSAEQSWRVYIIKGGPGTGKSTLMKRLCERALEQKIFHERIHCSSDPDSLDGVMLPEERVAVFDGTAPHVLEPTLAGACEQLVNIGQAWDSRLLFERRGEIARLTAGCALLHSQATDMLACAAAFRRRISDSALERLDRQKLYRAANRLSERCPSPRRARRGVERLRLMSAVTPDGVTAAKSLAPFDRVAPVGDRCFAPSGLLMAALREALLDKGLDIIVCPCSQDHSRIEHIIVPSHDMCYTVRGDAFALPEQEREDRAIRCERFLPSSYFREQKRPLAIARSQAARFTQLASDRMRQAREIHDRLETLYRSAMDYGIVNEMGERLSDEIFSALR